MSTASGAWLLAGFRHPARVELSTGHHLRPIRGSDVELVDELAGSALEAELATFVPRWVMTAWPFSRPAFGP